MELTGRGSAVGDDFGRAVAVWGGTVVVGDPGLDNLGGAIYVFTQTARGWAEAAELGDPIAKSRLGGSVGIWGTTVVAGASGSGWAYVVSDAAGHWHTVAELTNRDATTNDQFGQAVAISGPTIVVGAYLEARTGRAYVFVKTATGWSRGTELKGPAAGAPGSFGQAVAITGSTAVVSSLAERVYVFDA